MGKFSSLGVRELVRGICSTSRATAERCEDFDREGGLVAIGILPLSSEAEKWAQSESCDGIVLYMYELEDGGGIDRCFSKRIQDIVNQMEDASVNTKTRLFSDDFPVTSELGVATCYNIYDDVENHLVLKIFIFVSGEEVDAKTCCFSTRSYVKEWAAANGLWTPKLALKPARV